jgi:hypothetical protein
MRQYEMGVGAGGAKDPKRAPAKEQSPKPKKK